MPVMRVGEKGQGDSQIDPRTLNKISAYSTMNRFLQAFIDHVSLCVWDKPILYKRSTYLCLPDVFEKRAVIGIQMLIICVSLLL